MAAGCAVYRTLPALGWKRLESESDPSHLRLCWGGWRWPWEDRDQKRWGGEKMHFAAVLYLYAYMCIIANATLLIKQTGVIRFAVLEGLMCDVINSCSMCSKHRRATRGARYSWQPVELLPWAGCAQTAIIRSSIKRHLICVCVCVTDGRRQKDQQNNTIWGYQQWIHV